MLDGFVLLSISLKLTEVDWTPAGLWLAVVASGLYHGINPGMGWPLAVSAGLMERSSRALVAAFWPLTVGHLLAMLVVILPFALLVALVEWQQNIQVGASLLVIGFGIFRFVNRRHPRVLARIRPTQLGLWSFAVAIAHGAGLMLVPIYLGLCRATDLDKSHEAAGALINANLDMAVLVSVVHSVAMIDSRRIPSVASLPLPGSQVRVVELVQSGCELGFQPRLCGYAVACDKSGGPSLSCRAVVRIRVQGIADCGEPKETRLALLAQPSERRHHVTEHHLSDAGSLPGAERVRRGNRRR